jgi:hypothetical protein
VAAVIAAAVFALVSCAAPGNHTPPDHGSASADSGRRTPDDGRRTTVHVAHQPPTAKDVIDAAIASGDLPLSVSPTCASVGTESSDRTIGRYLAGFMAEMRSPDKKNWIETTIEPGQSGKGESVSICTLTLRHEDGDDRWGWGVRFLVRTSDGLVLPDSFTCVGAG